MMVPPESRILGGKYFLSVICWQSVLQILSQYTNDLLVLCSIDDPLKITARTFQKREQAPQDSSLWTETPADREKRLRGEPKDRDEDSDRRKRSKRRGDDEQQDYQRSRQDAEREEQIRKYNVRPVSFLFVYICQ